MTRKRAQRRARDEERPEVPERERPDAGELGGESEESLRQAGATPSSREVDARPRRPGPPDREDLSAEPGELGRRFLEDATQQPQQIDEYDQTENESEHETPQATMGERYIRGLTPGAGDERDELVTHLPDRTDHEERISEETRERQKERRLEKRRDSTV